MAEINYIERLNQYRQNIDGILLNQTYQDLSWEHQVTLIKAFLELLQPLVDETEFVLSFNESEQENIYRTISAAKTFACIP